MKKMHSFEYAELLYEHEHFYDALQMFKSLKDSKDNPDIQNYVGCCYLKLEQYLEAQKVFQLLIEKYPKWSRPIFNLGRVYMATDDNNVALEYFSTAVNIDPSSADAYYYLAVCFEKTNKIKEAIKNYRKSIELNPIEFEPHMGLSLCYDIVGETKKALFEAKTAFNLYACNDTLYNYTYLLNKSKEYATAYTLLQTHNVTDSNDLGLIHNLDLCSKMLNNQSGVGSMIDS